MKMSWNVNVQHEWRKMNSACKILMGQEIKSPEKQDV